MEVRIIVFLFYFVDTSTRTGFDKLARWSLATLVVIVAENKYVVRSFGMAFRMASMSGPKSMSNKRSASSRTWEEVTPFQLTATRAARADGKERERESATEWDKDEGHSPET